MNLEQATHWRMLAGKVSALCFLLFFLAVVDAVVARFREPPQVFHVLAGARVEVNGLLEDPGTEINDLAIAGADGYLEMRWQGIHQGFWLGGRMWRGVLLVSPATPPGDYRVAVSARPSGKVSALFDISVHADAASQRRSFKSIIARASGVAPGWVAVGLFPLGLLGMGVVLLLSRRCEALLAAEGSAEVYWAKEGDGGWQVAFGLGARHGLGPGSRLRLLDDRRQAVGWVDVTEVREDDAIGVALGTGPVHPGFVVTRN
jgi:hypothetical protein